MGGKMAHKRAALPGFRVSGRVYAWIAYSLVAPPGSRRTAGIAFAEPAGSTD